MQYHVRRGGDTWVITVNPRHRGFYQKVMGFCRSGPVAPIPRSRITLRKRTGSIASGCGWKPPRCMRMFLASNSPRVPWPGPAGRPTGFADFGHRSTQIDPRRVDELVLQIEHLDSPPRWQENGEWPDGPQQVEGGRGSNQGLASCGSWH